MARAFDYIVIGSGFGGSVSALRLAEKGYSVAVLERGKRYAPEDFPVSNWNLRRFFWAPKLFCYGIQAITFLRDVMILHGSGVGGGSLVYANTLLVPPDEIFEHPRWRHLGDWKNDLGPHYQTAKRMLGVTQAQGQGASDRLLRQIAVELGREHTYHETEVGVFFGEPGKTVEDPYFDGRGPARTGCTFCGGCMTGCRYGAKNTLDRNYLYLAEALGVEVIPETEVTDVEPTDGGYRVHSRRITDVLFKRKETFTAKGVIMAAGVLGTVELLFRCKERSLPNISDQLGNYVRTNSEALTGARSRRDDVDYSEGIAIASGFYPNDETHIEMVRYGKGHDAMSLLSTVLVAGGAPWPRWLRWLGTILTQPIRFLRSLKFWGWAQRTGILLVMQPIDNFLRVRHRRRWWAPWRRRLTSEWTSTSPVPKYFPVANEVAQRLADKMQGDAQSVLPEVLLNLTSTAHILGGCPMGASPAEGVIDAKGRLFGYENLFVVDGSIVPVNLSVNPSLTITALAEWVMSHIPAKSSSQETS